MARIRRELAYTGAEVAVPQARPLGAKAEADVGEPWDASTPPSFSQAAARLGYSEPSSFTRAFVAWFGEIPSANRRRSQGPGLDAFDETSLAIGA